MQNERYPSDLIISVQDFQESGWKEIITQHHSEGYMAMWQSLSDAARTNIAQHNWKCGKVLWLLADACSMMLDPISPNEPFKPFAVIEDRRSAIPDDFSLADIQFFTEIADRIDNYWLKARICDLLWLISKPRNTSFALKAIDSYRNVPLDAEIWWIEGQNCWTRSIRLAGTLKTVAGEQLKQMEETIITAFDTTNKDDGFLCLSMADLLKSNQLGISHKHKISEKLENLANEIKSENDFYKAKQYFSAAAKWYQLIKNTEKSAEMIANVAECWVSEATIHSTPENENYMVANNFYEKAIQIYRTIPKTERPMLQVDKRINELRTLLSNSGINTLSEMKVIQSPSIDITKFIEHSKKAITGKSVQDALLSFVNLYPGANVINLRESAIETRKKFFFQSMFSATTVSSDGRVIAKRPPISLGDNVTDDDEVVIRENMIRDFCFTINLVVKANILPALEVLHLEHRLKEIDFIELAQNSPIIPIGRAKLFGKALFSGYDGDFITALHLLIPQIENLIRVHLKQLGAQTTNLDKNGIENENGMSTLIGLPEIKLAFDENISFELEALFCNAFGPNLRNELAHGLLDDDSCNSASSIYAWWFSLKLILITWFQTMNTNSSIQEKQNNNEVS